MLQPLFVYGTLKRNFGLHFVLRDEVFCGEVLTATPCRLFDFGDWPALVECADGCAIHGELYQVTRQCLEHCDQVEDVASGLYERRRIRLSTAHSSVAAVPEAWCYFYLRSTDGMPDCGDRWPACGDRWPA